MKKKVVFEIAQMALCILVIFWICTLKDFIMIMILFLVWAIVCYCAGLIARYIQGISK